MDVHDIWFFICNPIANGGKTKKEWANVQKILESEKIAYEWVFTERNNHAIEITKTKIREGYRKFAVVGGDGSINEVVNGMFMQNEVQPSELYMGLIPMGTGNDWSRTHKIPSDIKKAVQLLKNNHIQVQDVGLAEFESGEGRKERYFNNVAGMSYDAFVAKYIEDLDNNNFSQLKYIYYVLYCLYKFTLPKAMIRYNGKTLNDKVYTINVGICKYNGGGLRLVPQAIPNDGKLALTIATELSKFKVVRNMYMFYTGTIGKLKEVITTHTTEVLVEQSGDEKILLELDGEYMGYAPIKFTVLPLSLNFIGNPDHQ